MAIRSGRWQIVRGRRKINADHTLERDTFVTQDNLDDVMEDEIHIFPAPMGSGKFGGIILGVVLIIVGVVLAIGTLGTGTIGSIAIVDIGVGLIIGGVLIAALGAVTAFSSPPETGDYEEAAGGDKKASFLYNGVVNNVEQGAPIPIVCGVHMTGSTVISANSQTIDILAKANTLSDDNAQFTNSYGDWLPVNSTLAAVGGELQVKATSAGTPGSARLSVAVLPATTYQLTCLARSPLIENAQSVRLRVEDASGQLAIVSSSEAASKELSLKVTIPAVNNGTALIYLDVISAVNPYVATPGIGYFDNIQAIKTIYGAS